MQHDYGSRWADIEGDADSAIVTFGSTTAAVRGRWSAPPPPARRCVWCRSACWRRSSPSWWRRALAGVRQVLVVEQNHGGQLLRCLRSRCDLPGRPAGLHRPGPLPLRPGDLANAFIDWAAAHAATGVPA